MRRLIANQAHWTKAALRIPSINCETSINVQAVSVNGKEMNTSCGVGIQNYDNYQICDSEIHATPNMIQKMQSATDLVVTGSWKWCLSFSLFQNLGMWLWRISRFCMKLSRKHRDFLDFVNDLRTRQSKASPVQKVDAAIGFPQMTAWKKKLLRRETTKIQGPKLDHAWWWATTLWTSQEKLMIISWLYFNWTSKFSGKLSKLRKSCLKEANKAAPSSLRTRQILHIETTSCCPMPNAVKSQWFSARTLHTRTHHLRLCCSSKQAAKLGELMEFVFWHGVNGFSRISCETLHLQLCGYCHHQLLGSSLQPSENAHAVHETGWSLMQLTQLMVQ